MTFKKVTRPTARKLFNAGQEIFVLPCKVSPAALQGKGWVQPVIISLATTDERENKFERTISAFEYYNCNNELGYYASFYVAEE